MTNIPSHRATMRQAAVAAREAAKLAITNANRVIKETTEVIESFDRHGGTVIPLNSISWFMSPAPSFAVDEADKQFMDALKAFKDEAVAAMQKESAK